MKFVTLATVKKDDDGKRCDRIFRIVLGKMPLGRIYKEIRSGFLRINGRRTKQEYKVSEGDSVDVCEHLAEFASDPEKERIPHVNMEAFGRRIAFEDDEILVVNKKKGELVHPDGKCTGFTTLDRIVKDYLAQECGSSISFSPGPLHRLDRNTSGLVAFGKSARGARDFSSSIQNREARKCYIALLEGTLEGRELWHDKLVRDEGANVSRALPLHSHTGDEAITIAAPFLENESLTLAQIEIKTGRTHQIRCQASCHGYPLLGDAKYRGSANAEGYYLHAACIIAGGRTITAAPDDDFISAVADLMHCPACKVKKAAENIVADFVRQQRAEP